MRNAVTRLIVLACLLASCLVSTLAQSSRVVVSRAGDDELRRTAYRIRLCPEQLGNARSALAAAQTLAPQVAGQVWLGELGSLLNRLDRPHAPAILSQLLEQLADRAGKAEDWKASQQIMSSAQQLLYALRETDPDAAEEIVRKWPEPEGGGAFKPYLQQMRTSLASDQFNWLGRSDPLKAMQRLPEFEAGKVNLQARNNLLQQLIGVGADEAAGRLLDDSVAAAREAGLDAGSVYSFGQLFSTASYAFPDRLPNLVSQLDAVLRGIPEDSGGDVYAGQAKIPVSGRESLVLSIVRSLSNRPDMVNRLLNLIPGLRQKLEPLGGIDGFLSPGPPPKPPTTTSQHVISEWRSGKVSEASLADLEAGDPSPQDLNELMQAAGSLCDRDPDRAAAVWERAGEILAKKGGIQAVQYFQSLIAACVGCQGALTPSMVERGNELLARFRREQTQAAVQPPDFQPRQMDPRFLKEQADRFEAQLIAAQAIEDFGRAMDLADKLADPAVRYQTYIQIAQLIAR